MKGRASYTLSDEALAVVAKFSERFGVPASGVVELAILTLAQEQRQIDSLISEQGFDVLVAVLRRVVGKGESHHSQGKLSLEGGRA